MSQKFSSAITNLLQTAEAKALATTGPHGINVVPISMIKVNENTIWLFDFFMSKSNVNLQAEPYVALTAWTGMKGIQIKGNTSYHTQGEDFEAAVRWVKKENPSRVVRGLIILQVDNIYDISPGRAFITEELVL